MRVERVHAPLSPVSRGSPFDCVAIVMLFEKIVNPKISARGASIPPSFAVHLD